MQGRDHEPAEPSSPGPAQCPGSLGLCLSPDSGPGSDLRQILSYLYAQVTRGSGSRIPSHTREGAGCSAPLPALTAPALTAPHSLLRTHCPALTAPRTHRLGSGDPAAAACPRPRHRGGRGRSNAGPGSGSASGVEQERVSGDPGAGRPRPSLPAEGGAAHSSSKPRGSAGMLSGLRAGLARKGEAKINRSREK